MKDFRNLIICLFVFIYLFLVIIFFLLPAVLANFIHSKLFFFFGFWQKYDLWFNFFFSVDNVPQFMVKLFLIWMKWFFLIELWFLIKGFDRGINFDYIYFFIISIFIYNLNTIICISNISIVIYKAFDNIVITVSDSLSLRNNSC